MPSRVALAIVALSAMACASAPSPSPATLRIGGSDTMGVLLRRWAEEFMRLHPGVVVETSGGGSGVGIDGLIDERLDVAAASRPMLPGEVRRLHERQGVLGVSHRCARDALSIYLHPSNPVRELSLDELRRIYTGRAVNWRELGGDDREIEPLGRPPASGTQRLFRDLVLETDSFASRVVTLPTTAAICERVAVRPGAIGYGGVAFGASLTHASIEGVEARPETVRRGTYPLGRYLYLLTARPPSGVARSFVDWALGPDGQAVVEEVGYVSLWRSEATAPGRAPAG